jgi:hypothetical protein
LHGCRFEDVIARVGEWIELDLDEDGQKLRSAKIDRGLAVQTTTSLVEKRSRPRAAIQLDDLLQGWPPDSGNSARTRERFLFGDF